MLYTKFQGHRPFGVEGRFFKVFTILIMWPGPFEQTFVPLSHGDSIWNLAWIGPVVSEEKMFENVDTHTHIHTHIHTYIHTYTHTYGRQRPTYPISSPLSLRLRWANNECKKKWNNTVNTHSHLLITIHAFYVLYCYSTSLLTKC